MIVDVLAVQPEFLRDRPQDVKKVVLGWFDAVEYWKNNRSEANAIVAKFFNLPTGELEEMLSGVKFSDLERNLKLFGSVTATGTLYEVGEAAGDIWQESGVLKSKPMPMKQLIDGTVVNGLAQPGR